MIGKRHKPLAVTFCTPNLKGDVLPFDVTELEESLPKSLKKAGRWQVGGQNANSVEFCGLLRARHERPCRRNTPDKADKFPPPHGRLRHERTGRDTKHSTWNGFAYVRFGLKADMCSANAHVRSGSKADIPPFIRLLGRRLRADRAARSGQALSRFLR